MRIFLHAAASNHDVHRWDDPPDTHLYQVVFIHTGQSSKAKSASQLFQKYGMVDGQVAYISDNTQQGADHNYSHLGEFFRIAWEKILVQI